MKRETLLAAPLIGGVLMAIIIGGGIIAELEGDSEVTPQSSQIDTGRYLSPEEAKTAVCQGATDIGTSPELQGCGRIDICGAFNAAATVTGNPIYVCDRPVLSVGGISMMPNIE